jgi:uncharacterized iron-regulated protein
MDDARLTQIEKSIEEIKESQVKVAQALLGSYEKNSVGLIEESRNLRRDVDESKVRLAAHQAQIDEAIEFKKDAKKIVTVISLIVPFVFKALEVGLSAVWELLKAN